MNLPRGLGERCAEVLGLPVLEERFLGGGDISAARLLRTDRGNFFLKYQETAGAFPLFDAEARGLQLMRGLSPIRIPQVLSCGSGEAYAYLLLEYIEPGLADNPFWEHFGAALAAMHSNSALRFGLEFRNFIGRLPQENAFHDNWTDFYREMRLEPQLRLALSRGLLGSMEAGQMARLYKKLPEIFPEEKPALVHGDLWSGNFLVSNKQEPVLIDPSVSYAHREMDIAMSRLFGGFDWRFYRSYEEVSPLAPGVEERIPIYQLYYLLVHLNMFGRGYLSSVREVLGKF